jgi:tetratricopeptide (TPR) repeat protein
MLNFDAGWAVLRRGLLALVAVASLAATAALADEMQDATQLLKAGKRQQALEQVNKVLATKPQDPQARFLKGLIFTEQGNTKEAIEIFTKLTQDFPELPEPYNNLAVIYASQGQYEKARTALEQSIRTHPSYATAYENLGDVYAKLASQAYDKALQLDSSNAGAQNKLSLVRELVGGPSVAKAPPTVARSTPPAAPAKAPAKAAEKPAPAKLATAPAAPAPVQAVNPVHDSAEVLKTLKDWAQDWSRKDAQSYLAHYAKDFRTPGGESRDKWERTRRARIAAPKSISVQITSPKVTISGNNQATVTFRQSYHSDRFTGESNKTIVMVKRDGRWLIQQEKVGG